ncbi:hypothetical protein APA_2301 [Pseudanabaena sp. lw0831]|nr:hypothetical protein APA_2301 [Pseudanabaena sp. lw0831]
MPFPLSRLQVFGVFIKTNFLGSALPKVGQILKLVLAGQK